MSDRGDMSKRQLTEATTTRAVQAGTTWTTRKNRAVSTGKRTTRSTADRRSPAR
jgi:hypothetical protein